MDLRNWEVDSLLVFEENWDSVVVLLVGARTEEDPSPKWWMVKNLGSVKLGMEIHECCHGGCSEKNSWLEAAHRCKKMVAMSLTRCLDDGETKGSSRVFEFLLRKCNMLKMQIERMKVFCVFAAASRVWNGQKIPLYMSV